MSKQQSTAIRRLKDGSINLDFYQKRAHLTRSRLVHDLLVRWFHGAS